MSEKRLSKRKLESYKRAEIVARALRKHVTAGSRETQADINYMMDCLLDWMAVSGQHKYDPPVRRGRKNYLR